MKYITILATILVMLNFASSHAQKKRDVTILTTASAPVPTPQPINITHLLDDAGPFRTFLRYLQYTKVIEIFETQANNTEEGLTIFVPKDSSFSSLKNPSLANLTKDELKQLCLFHALPHYYTLSDFKNLSNVGPIRTFAGGDYTLNFTDVSGTTYMSSGWSVTKISSSVSSAPPFALYQVDKVLLPEAIFGTNIPPTLVPASAPKATPPTADHPDDDTKVADKNLPSTKNSSPSSRVVGNLVLALLGVVILSL